MIINSEKQENRKEREKLERSILLYKKQNQMFEQGYTYREIPYGLKGEIISFSISIFFVCLFFIFFSIYNLKVGRIIDISYMNTILFILEGIVIIIINKMIRIFLFKIFSKNYISYETTFKKSQFSFIYIIPFIIIGVIPYFLGLIIGNFLFISFGGFAIICVSKDLYNFIRIILCKCNDREILFMDDPYKLGFFVFEKEVEER